MANESGNDFAELEALRDALAFGLELSDKVTPQGQQFQAWLKAHPHAVPTALKGFERIAPTIDAALAAKGEGAALFSYLRDENFTPELVRERRITLDCNSESLLQIWKLLKESKTPASSPLSHLSFFTPSCSHAGIPAHPPFRRNLRGHPCCRTGRELLRLGHASHPGIPCFSGVPARTAPRFPPMAEQDRLVAAVRARDVR